MSTDNTKQPGVVSETQQRMFDHVDRWGDDGSDMAVDSAFSRASRGEKSPGEQRRDASYDDDGPNSREERESEFERAGRRGGARAAGVEEGDGDLDAAVAAIETVAARIGLPEEVAAAINPAAADIVADFATLVNDLHLSDNHVASIGEWLASEAEGGHSLPDASITAQSVARQLGIDPALLGSLSRADLAMASRFASVARDTGLDAHQAAWLVRWASENSGRVPASSGRSAGRDDGGGGSWHTTGEGIPRVITKADIPKMSTPQLQGMMRSNFNLYVQSGAQQEYAKRLARGGR
jgi:hypothetical protein